MKARQTLDRMYGTYLNPDKIKQTLRLGIGERVAPGAAWPRRVIPEPNFGDVRAQHEPAFKRDPLSSYSTLEGLAHGEKRL